MSTPFELFACPLEGVRLIEASAGTGKTWNICGLYLRLLLEKNLAVQQILVVTFTNAATAELRDRIRARIAEVLAAVEGRATQDEFVARLLATMHERGIGEEAMRLRLTRALRGFDEAAIFTIHGFCKRALDDAPFAAGLPLAQELVEDDSDLRHEVANDFWRLHVSGADLHPALAAWLLRKRESPQRWADLLKRHAGKPLAKVLWPEADEAAVIAPPASLEERFERARALWLADRDRIVGCVTQALPRLNGTRYKPESVQAATEAWDSVFLLDSLPPCPPQAEKLDLFARSKLQPKKNHAPCDDHEFFHVAQELVDAWSTQEGELERARWHLLKRVVQEGPSMLRERKRGQRVVAFDDMLFNVYDRLAHEGGEALAATLRRRFPAALVDEFQDTDPLQFAIFHRVYANATGLPLFLVGDPKQAIYGFRNADLHTYLRARETAASRYTLDANQRSTAQLLDGLNALFGANPRAFMLDGLAYRAVKEGGKKRGTFVDRSASRAPLQLWNIPLADDGLPPLKAYVEQSAAQACAAEIARLLAAAQAGDITLDGRALAAGDVAVLVRSHKEGSLMREELQKLDIGSVELRQTSVFASPDAQELEAVLLAIADPASESALRAALATELLGFDANRLDALALDEPALLACIARFEDYRDSWRDRGVALMLRELIAREGIAGRMLCRTDGERRLTNLRHLSELLNEAAEAHPGADALLRWLRRERRDASAGEATQVRLESDRTLVQIVTIHKSKGLEYPVVLCPFLWNGAAGGGGPQLPGSEYHDDGGVPVIDYRNTRDDASVKGHIRLEADAERLRLIYVALTRAVHRCYLVVGGYARKVGASSTTIVECTRNPLNWLVAGEQSTPAEWAQNRVSIEEVFDAWQRLATRAAGAVALDPLPAGRGRRVALPRSKAEALSALPAPKSIPRGWRIGSYSMLAHGVERETEAAAADRDARASDDAERKRAGARIANDARIAADDILRFPRGARAGECLHAVFESADFGDDSSWPDAIARTLRTRPPAPRAQSGELAPMVRRMLADVLAARLPGGLVLREVHADKRRAEFEFSLATPALDMRRITAALRRHGIAAGSGTQALQGYLRGFIDLVFEQGGRFHIVDWKSNWLGADAADYSPLRVRQAMDEGGYHLQYLLYTVAVHRWLARRLARYDYDSHFGGVYYLFVRGVRPSWVAEDGSAAGVFHTRPPRALVEELDTMLGRPRETRA
ncbi:MAG TPA: exodeoxyribonuclease V subunit beta [Ramlibacter sp.]|uniref:exodeoxyribonuclease V subunit beta n=1 Tax=Ramlibacter sp. TaxID=1917967 RepID=UPI002CB8F814|nr:exodeoxyribonuclease V subunit beta [Ramlibacter sp.]HVZ46876.1 exodeoxyribonuclease V subunit beta [Ramlibacter sp.]